MRRVIHLADLHLSRAELQYSLSVLDEVLALAREHAADLLLFAGDVFDSYADAVMLAPEVRKRADSLPETCRAVAIPGNHEHLERNDADLAALDLGRIEWLTAAPFAHRSFHGLDLIAIPFRSSYADYVAWEVPDLAQREAQQREGSAARIVMIHGTLAGMWFSGLDENETDTAAIDQDLFRRFGASYAALGHIHTPHSDEFDGCTACYPGSARVWRRGELGPRQIRLLEFDGGRLQRNTVLTLKSAGRYRYLELPVGIDLETLTAHLAEGRIPGALGAGAIGAGTPGGGALEAGAPGGGAHEAGAPGGGDDPGPGPADVLELAPTGLVETQAESARLVRAIRQGFESRVRKLVISTEGLQTLSGVSTLPLARRFLEHWHRRWEHAASEQQRELLLEARRSALIKIKQRVEGRT